MLKLSPNLKTLMANAEINESELARQTGVSQPVIHRMANGETDNPKLETLRPLAKFFDVSLDQLIGDAPLTVEQSKTAFTANNLMFIPIISLEDTLNWPNNRTEMTTHEEVVIDVQLSSDAYGIRLNNKTMEPYFPLGTLIIIDPNLSYQDNDFVIVHQATQKRAVFRQILVSEQEHFLKPLNPDFPTVALQEKDKVLGVMVQARIDFKK